MKFKLAATLSLMIGGVYGQQVVLDQVGFSTWGSKKAVLKGGTEAELTIKDLSGNSIATLTPGIEKEWTPAGEKGRKLDFTGVSAPGEYAFYLDTAKISPNFKISENPHADAFKNAIRFFYYQRASTALPEEHAEIWNREAGHPDSVVYFHSSTDVVDLEKAPSAKGWYDAGDYGKYVVNSGISTYTLMDLYESFPTYFDTLTWNLPESSNGIPDLLDEVRWNLDWLLTMQDQSDGGVFHKVTTKNFVGSVMPAKGSGRRYFLAKSTTATLDFAAVLAKASRLYYDIDPELSKECLSKAMRAWDWADENYDVSFSNPRGVGTGGYGDGTQSDEFVWAAAELYLSTKNERYLQTIKSYRANGGAPSWQNVKGLALYTILNNKSSFPEEIVTVTQETYNEKRATMEVALDSSIYSNAMGDNSFHWGSNGQAASQGIYMFQEYLHSGDTSAIYDAEDQLGYLLGKNPLNMSYVTGEGSSYPMNPHHRPSEADGITEPVPGMIVGGPHSGGQDERNCGEYTTYPAVSYIDDHCSYATNEVAINWNSPYAYLVGALEAVRSGHKAHAKRFPAIPQAIVDSITLPITDFPNQLSVVSKGNVLDVKTQESGLHEFKIMDLKGSVLIRKSMHSNPASGVRLSIEGLDKGKYFLFISKGKRVDFISILRN